MSPAFPSVALTRRYIVSRAVPLTIAAIVVVSVLAAVAPLTSPVLLREEATEIRTPLLLGCLPALCWLPGLQVTLGDDEQRWRVTQALLRLEHVVIAGLALMLPGVVFAVRVGADIGLQYWLNALFFLGLVLAQLASRWLVPAWSAVICVAALTWLMGVHSGTHQPYAWAFLLHDLGPVVGALDVAVFALGAAWYCWRGRELVVG